MTHGLSQVRLYGMRFYYLVIVLILGSSAWPALISKGENWDTLHGVAYSFWASMTVLALFGIRFPLKMLPLLLTQFAYKLIWLAAVGYPLWSAGKLGPNPMSDGLFKACALGVVIDLIVIPWSYVYRTYIAAVASPKWRDDVA